MADFEWIRPGYELVKTNFEWNVQVPFLHTVNGKGEGLRSSVCSQQKTPNSKWTLFVIDNKDDVVIRVNECNSMGEPVHTVEVEPFLVKMSILNKRGKKVLQEMLPSNTSHSNSSVRFYLCKEDLTKCQQADGSLTFHCTILSRCETGTCFIIS
jgi:hypothetical protein